MTAKPLRSMRESLERNPPTPEEAATLLDALRWHEDMVVTNDFDERMWLKPLIVNGKRIGITDCCFESDPCPRHRALRDAITAARANGIKTNQNNCLKG
jgi:hypothetical protein